MPKVLTDFLHLFFPQLCVVCGSLLAPSERHICTHCILDLPRTNLHKLTENSAERIFWGRAKVERATSFLYYKKESRYVELLYSLKYKGKKQLGITLGKLAGADLLINHYFGDVDLIIPVPLHKEKLRDRGYNQSEWLCKGLSEIFQIPYSTKYLIRSHKNPTQTKIKTMYERHLNTNGIFDATNQAELIGKHILLVDDVLTTGATLEGCIAEINKIPDTKVSVFTLMIAPQ